MARRTDTASHTPHSTSTKQKWRRSIQTVKQLLHISKLSRKATKNVNMRFKVVDMTSDIQDVMQNHDSDITKSAPARCDTSIQTTPQQREDVPSLKGEEIGVASQEPNYLFSCGEMFSRVVDSLVALWLDHGGSVIVLLVLGVLASWVDVC